MARFEELKRKALDAAETLADKSYELYKVAESKTKQAAKVTKMNAELTRQKGALKRMYAELGMQYHDSCVTPPEELAQIFAEIDNMKDSIEALKAEIDSCRCDNGCDCCCEEDYDDIEVEIVEEDAPETPEENNTEAE